MLFYPFIIKVAYFCDKVRIICLYIFSEYKFSKIRFKLVSNEKSLPQVSCRQPRNPRNHRPSAQTSSLVVFVWGQSMSNKCQHFTRQYFAGKWLKGECLARSWWVMSDYNFKTVTLFLFLGKCSKPLSTYFQWAKVSGLIAALPDT